MTSDSGVNYETVLADLEARKAQLESAIAAIKQIMGQAGGATASGGGNGNGTSQVIRPDTFFRKSIPEAAKMFLAMSKAPKSTAEIAKALEDGGLTHQSGNFGNTVGSVLMRQHKSSGDIVNIKRGTWGLAEWYGSKPRRKVSEKEEQEAGADDGASDDASDDLVA